MIDIKVTQFFDKASVNNAVEKPQADILSKAGAFIRQRAYTSIRRRKKTASPGSPPSSHTDLLRKLIFFGYDSATKSVVIGPKLFKTPKGSLTAPQALEFGGTTLNNKGQSATYRAFPFMAPALAAEQDKFKDLFLGAIKS
jgi:hypothetical protein